jgi:hypothetical protein
MPSQTLTIQLDGLTAGDYLAHLRDPEPPALGYGLRSVAVRADLRSDTVEATLVWDDVAPAPRVAAQAAGLPLVAEVARVEATEVRAPAARREPAPAPAPAPKPGRLSALTERAALRLAAQARPAAFAPQVLRWA